MDVVLGQAVRVSGNGMLVGISATAWATPGDSRTASGSQPASAAQQPLRRPWPGQAGLFGRLPAVLPICLKDE
ncbi:hypothetical protein ACF1G5_30195 [Streptomyces coeruleorubidus]|uniref:hypothetical protein n=1 Tax=Streptomyces coeruleorubidus TaxID=116188 RepID=UPI0036FA54C4